MNKLFKQIFRFIIVGGTAFIIDFGLLIILTEWFLLNYLTSNAIAFTLSVIYNYILSMLWVFEISKSKFCNLKIFVSFIILSIIGLLLNQTIMWYFTEIINVYYILTKIFATILVMIYNFITRKLFLESRYEFND